MNISKGFKNLFTPTIINIIIAICLFIIIVLIYLKTKKIDLFSPDIALTNNDFLSTFISKYVNNIQQQSNYMKTLATQQQTIQNLTQKVSGLINPST
jgi:hypothetical protein